MLIRLYQSTIPRIVVKLSEEGNCQRIPASVCGVDTLYSVEHLPSDVPKIGHVTDVLTAYSFTADDLKEEFSPVCIKVSADKAFVNTHKIPESRDGFLCSEEGIGMDVTNWSGFKYYSFYAAVKFYKGTENISEWVHIPDTDCWEMEPRPPAGLPILSLIPSMNPGYSPSFTLDVSVTDVLARSGRTLKVNKASSTCPNGEVPVVYKDGKLTFGSCAGAGDCVPVLIFS